jgi:hypothetical protein
MFSSHETATMSAKAAITLLGVCTLCIVLYKHSNATTTAVSAQTLSMQSHYPVTASTYEQQRFAYTKETTMMITGAAALLLAAVHVFTIAYVNTAEKRRKATINQRNRRINHVIKLLARMHNLPMGDSRSSVMLGYARASKKPGYILSRAGPHPGFADPSGQPL